MSLNRMPAEWANHQGILMEWPVPDPVWAEDIHAAKRAFGQVARTIAAYEPVTMIVNPGEVAEANELCGGSAVILEIAHNDCWARDNGPTFVKTDTGALAGINWRFNAWGGKFPYALDDKIPEEFLARIQIERIDAPIVLEGGSIHTNGTDTLLTTQECLLNPNRNPGLSRTELELLLCGYLGVQRIIWLPWGLEGDETDGHVDNVCCFMDERTVLMPWTDDQSDPNYKRLSANRAVLEAAGLQIEFLPQPPAILHRGEPLTLSYINFLFVNGGIVLPVFGGIAAQADAIAVSTIKRLFPNRRVATINSLDILKGGGNIHCITQQIPSV
jgi:agmatine deiminase